mmetsp:Transcript_20766/g.65339  ORF Transcript_20766/g.65339 Transcript_20766/m.65339 type:complete len:201 (+) Transcript_20766:120-722(+)
MMLARAAAAAARPALRQARPMSQLVVSVVGPDRVGVVNDVTRTVASSGGNVLESNSFSIGSVFSMSLLIDVGHDQHTILASAVQDAVPQFAVTAHENEAGDAAPAFAAALEVTCADGVGLIAEVTEFVANSGLSLSKLETKSEAAPMGGSTLFSLNGVMLSKGSVDEAKLAQGFKDLETRMGVSIDYCLFDDEQAAKMVA